MLTMDLKSWRLYAIPPSVCFAVLDFPPLLLVYATTVFILKPLCRSCLLLFFRTHKPYILTRLPLTLTVPLPILLSMRRMACSTSLKSVKPRFMFHSHKYDWSLFRSQTEWNDDSLFDSYPGENGRLPTNASEQAYWSG